MPNNAWWFCKFHDSWTRFQFNNHDSILYIWNWGFLRYIFCSICILLNILIGVYLCYHNGTYIFCLCCFHQSIETILLDCIALLNRVFTHEHVLILVGHRYHIFCRFWCTRFFFKKMSVVNILTSAFYCLKLLVLLYLVLIPHLCLCCISKFGWCHCNTIGQFKNSTIF